MASEMERTVAGAVLLGIIQQYAAAAAMTISMIAAAGPCERNSPAMLPDIMSVITAPRKNVLRLPSLNDTAYL